MINKNEAYSKASLKFKRMKTIGIFITSIASMAIVASIFSLYKLWISNNLTKTFWKKKWQKFVLLYSFWISLFVAGISMLQESTLAIPSLKIAFIILLFYTTLKLVGSLLSYFQLYPKNDAQEKEEDEFGVYDNILKKAVIIDFIGWLIILGITILVFNLIRN